MHYLIRKLAVLVPVGACAAPALAQPVWIANGPDGGIVHDVAASTLAIHAATADGIYRSLDDGASWTRVDFGARGAAIESIEASPDHPDVLLAAGSGSSWRSNDGGATWAVLAPPAPLARFVFGMHANEVLGVPHSGSPVLRSSNLGQTWTAIATLASGLQPTTLSADPNLDYYYAIDNGQQLRRSPDGGTSWTSLTATLAAPGMNSPLLVDPTDPGTVLLAANNLDASYVGRYRVASGVLTPVHHAYTGYAFVADPFTSGRIWLSARTEFPIIGERLFESADHGETWSDVASDRPVRLVAADHRIAGRLYGTSTAGMEVSTDAGRHWTTRTRGIPLAAVTALSLDPRVPSTVLAATEGNGVGHSSDAGTTWSFVNDGLTSLSVLGLIRSPFDADRVYAGTTAGLFRSDDGGAHWLAVPLTQYPSGGVPRFSHLQVDRADASRLTAVEGLSRVMWSDDGGSAWRIASGSTGIRKVFASGAGSARVYGLVWVSGTSYKLRRAASHGAAFEDTDPSVLLSALAVHPHDDAIVVGILPSSPPHPVILSTDAGMTWQARGAIPGSSSFPLQIRFDPCASGVLHAANGSTHFRSDDLGASWQQDALAIPAYTVADLAVACAQDQRVIAVGLPMSGAQLRVEPAVERIFQDGFDAP